MREKDTLSLLKHLFSISETHPGRGGDGDGAKGGAIV